MSIEPKIVFTGPPGAGKTTAITALSDVAPVSTDVANHDAGLAKLRTTVGLDFGSVRLGDGETVRLYGTPGQDRFSFMWEIVGRGAMGVILLIDGSSPNAIPDLRSYATAFRRIAPAQPFIVGVGRTGPEDIDLLDGCAMALDSLRLAAPVFSVDVRKREDVLLLIETLLASLELREPDQV